MSQIGQLVNPTGLNAQTLTGDTGGAVGPDGAGNINIFGGDTVTVTGNPGTNTLTVETLEGGYPITPYVVGPVGQAGYQTVQSAIDAAFALEGGGGIWIQPGTYTEDLVFPDGISCALVTTGDEDAGAAEIIGVHTPPDSGDVVIWRVKMTSSTHIFDSAAAGTANLTLVHNNYSVNGYLFNCPNWTASAYFATGLIADRGSTASGIVNNTGGVTFLSFENTLGVGNTFPMIVSGVCVFEVTNVGCPVNCGSGTDIDFYLSNFTDTITLSGTATGKIHNTYHETGANAAFSLGMAGTVDISNVIVNSSANPSIAGAGAGTVTLASVTFLDDANIAGTLTTDSGNFYSGTLKADYAVNGVILGQGSVADLVATAAGTDGQVLIGATGADPAFATITSTGGTITFTPGANTLNMEAGASVPTQFDTDSGSAVPALGILQVLGANGITTSGATNVVTVTGSGASIFEWVDVTGTSDNMEAGKGYMANNGGLVTLTLPATAAQGTVVRVAGVGAGGWIIDQGTGQSINYLGTSTTLTTGTLAGDEVNACLELLCIVADTTWLALSSTGNFTIT